MFSRTLIRAYLHSLQISTTAAPNSKQYYRKFITSHNTPKLNAISCFPRRSYSEQVKLEEMIVDYEKVNKATSDKNVLIVDVREPDEIKEHGKIPSSINIPLGNVSTVLSTMSESDFQKTYQRPKPNEETEIIFYCMIGKRSGMAQQNAHNLGFKNVKNYLGSWTEWATKVQYKNN